jgi:hypothetical protein
VTSVRIDTSGRSPQHLGAARALQALHVLGDGRLREVELLGRPAEAAQLRDQDERAQGDEVHVTTLSIDSTSLLDAMGRADYGPQA